MQHILALSGINHLWANKILKRLEEEKFVEKHKLEQRRYLHKSNHWFLLFIFSYNIIFFVIFLFQTSFDRLFGWKWVDGLMLLFITIMKCVTPRMRWFLSKNTVWLNFNQNIQLLELRTRIRQKIVRSNQMRVLSLKYQFFASVDPVRYDAFDIRSGRGWRQWCRLILTVDHRFLSYMQSFQD